ncbi:MULTISPECIES: TetR/AcrR family transcriptional regulator [Burkholderia]|uniref:TetR/AcrR family transcriptional regulator n=1 Tax=Burkholderia TaxID=32008 RepID=UPI000468E17D|nr:MULTISPECIES: TetR/AcrR family transcriptional regulator [Burkholderia]MDN7500582.1 TetR/AcrR family transcriptional regulator [Burkholderia gladioli]MDN7603845.1 TetR/AcrR family transcriptional regulator [Burkholderia gladioli]NRF88542.1 TetR/AcrR family transcriptional regulator [Burkholderia gladioli]PRH28791.1 TetR/AcrR family transcriptional regulator [Burkholderia gladioli]
MNRSSKNDASEPARSRMSRESRYQQLLDVAESEFIRQGYQGTTMEDIARAAGVSRPIVYGHFGTKDGVYLACLQRARNRLEQQMLRNILGTQDPRERLRRASRAYFEFVASNSESWDLLFGGGTAIAGLAAERVHDLRLGTIRQIGMIITQSVPQIDALTVDIYAHAISGAAEQVAKWWRRNPGLTIDQLLDYLVAFVEKGVTPFLVNEAGVEPPAASEPVKPQDAPRRRANKPKSS